MDDTGNSETTYFNVFDEPEEQKKEIQEEKGKAQEGIRLLEDIIARWEARVAFYDSVNSINVDADTDPKAHLIAVLANKQTKANLEEEKGYLESLRRSLK